MAEEKILIPAYKRIGSCVLCGADIYSPALIQSSGSGWPLMSACACEHGPKIAGRGKTEVSTQAVTAKLEEQAQAA